MAVIVEWSSKWQFLAKNFVRKYCTDCPCGDLLTCKSACLGGEQLPLEEAAKRLYKPTYTRRINRKKHVLILKVVGFHCEGREMARLNEPEAEQPIWAGWMTGESGR